MRAACTEATFVLASEDVKELGAPSASACGGGAVAGTERSFHLQSQKHWPHSPSINSDQCCQGHTFRPSS